MTLTGFVVAATAVALLAGISIAANGRFRDHKSLPMQWSLSSRVNWSAPRPLALAFTPILAAIVLFAIAALLSGHPGAPLALAMAALSFVGAHLLHLYLLARHTASLAP